MPHLFARVIARHPISGSCSARSVAYSLLLLGFLQSRTFAQQITIDLDPAEATIAFVLGDVLHTVRGTFRMKTGSIQLDAAAKRISGRIVVDASSGDSGSGARDKRMKREILEVQRYPEITFSPTAIEGLSTNARISEATVSGWFDIHGQRHQITFPVHIERSEANVTAVGDFVVPYVDWGMKNPSTFILRVNDKVTVKVRAIGRIRPAPAQ